MPTSSKHQRSERRHRLLQLLKEGTAETQDELVQRLASEGFPVTQATVSRDLDDLGAVRVRHGDRTVYRLPERNGPPLGFGKRVFSELILDAASSGSLVVVRTFPGMASTVAAVLDQAAISGLLGTVAGDDTVLVVADERTGGGQLASRILQLGRERGAS